MRIDVWLLHEATAGGSGRFGFIAISARCAAAGLIGTYGVGAEQERADGCVGETSRLLPGAAIRVVGAGGRGGKISWSVCDSSSRHFWSHSELLRDRFRTGCEPLPAMVRTQLGSRICRTRKLWPECCCRLRWRRIPRAWCCSRRECRSTFARTCRRQKRSTRAREEGAFWS